MREYVKTFHENTFATPSTTHLSGDLIDLDEVVKSEMETSKNMGYWRDTGEGQNM